MASIRDHVARKQARRLAAKSKGRRPVDYRPTERESQESRERWDAIKHEVPDAD
jgi:hypothetical protein